MHLYRNMHVYVNFTHTYIYIDTHTLVTLVHRPEKPLLAMSFLRSPLRTVDTPWAMVLEHLAAGASAPTVAMMGSWSHKDQCMSHKSCRFWPQVFKVLVFGPEVCWNQPEWRKNHVWARHGVDINMWQIERQLNQFILSLPWKRIHGSCDAFTPVYIMQHALSMEN